MDFSTDSSGLFDDDRFSDEVLGVERLEQLALTISGELGITKSSSRGLHLLPEIQKAADELLNAYLFLTKDFVTHGLTPASEWFLDNFHIIEDQLRSIKRDLPKGFYDELPKIKEGSFKGYPRVYAIASIFVEKTDSRLDLEAIKRFVTAYQKSSPLTIGELWAIAITFRISLIKKLHPLVERIIFARQKREEADGLADRLLVLATKADVKSEELVTFLAENLKQQDKFNRPFLVQLIQRLRDQDPGVAKAFDWLENILLAFQTSTGELVKQEHYRQAAAQVTIGNIISSMRLLSNIDWHDFFEDVSLVDPILSQDHAYPLMDRATRDFYRKSIERISKRTECSEIQVASAAIEKAQRVDSLAPEDLRKKHVGYFLVDKGVFELEEQLSYKSPIKEKIVRFIDEDPAFIYFGSLVLIMIFSASLILNVFSMTFENSYYLFGFLALIAIPISEFSICLLNYIITLLRAPKRLPRMETEKGIPESATTMVVVPCLLSDVASVTELISNLEVQFLANQDQYIYYALLGDLTDAQQEVLEKDKVLLSQAQFEIENLNRRYKSGATPRFYFFHRARLFNPSEEKWICWERKRGKIMEFNRLLRGDRKTTYLNQDLDFDFFKQVEYVITLDADTQLPLQNARRLIGTITHPLNQPVFCNKKNRIIAGYGILQPRIAVSIVSAAKTKFSRIFSGNTGIDPYTTAVSDVYQDLFNEGSFTGKGLYVVDAFEKVIGDRVPENTVLSHDLLEGNYARVGLTTDLELIDDFPSGFEVFVKRLHRWTRGDWQIALWLLPFAPNHQGKWVKNDLPLIARWKIFDNLRRSLLTPMLLLWLLLSWTVLPGNSLDWTVAIIIVMGFPVWAPSFTDLFRPNENTWREHFNMCLSETKVRLEQIILMMIFMPTIAIDQLDAVTRSLYRMIVSKKHMLEWVTFSQTQQQSNLDFSWKEIMTSGPVFSGLIVMGLSLYRPGSLISASPFLISWTLAPLVARLTRKRVKPKIDPLSTRSTQEFRRYARLTWHFFERFAGKDNQFLAPDNFQEDPQPVVARRTSPTNIGLQFLSILSAYDLGYIGFGEMVKSLENTMETVLKLQKLHGHFYNWYDTLTLAPLEPRYISTVDSGNLAGHLVALKQACLKLSEGHYHNSHGLIGLKDSLMVLSFKIKHFQKSIVLQKSGSFKKILQDIEHLHDSNEENWSHLLSQLNVIRNDLLAMIPENSEILKWVETTARQIQSFEADLLQNEQDLKNRLLKIADQSQALYMEMDFKFLFNDERKIFTIGFNASEGRKDDSYYDLLASESRLASFFAIAKGDVPDEHWFRLGRKLTGVVGSRALISWSATMFEYLMPLLVMRRYEETLLDQTYDSVVLRQIEYGNQRQIPWGVSEAGYNARDLSFNYQYGPFGIPGLGLKRGLRDELVISPYSTMLSAMILPNEALENLMSLEQMGVLGEYGFYESIDYTQERVPKDKKFVILKSFMAHHQGMSLISINNLLNRSIMQRRFHAEPRVKAVQLLLQERIPAMVQIAKPRAEETHTESFARFSENHYTRSYTDPSLSTPRTQILSNGNYSVMVTSAGSGYSKCEERMVTRWREDSTQDHWGQFIYIQNMGTQKTWSSGFQPLDTKPKRYEAHFAEDKIEIYRDDYGITTHTEIIVSSEDNVELRRVTLTNNSDREVELEITSYMEVALAKANDDAAHPAFSNLFIQTEFCPETNSLLATRRRRSKNDIQLWGLHVLTTEAVTIGPVQYETDRSRFIGRGRNVKNPIVMTNEIDLSNTVGAVLDPIFSLRQRIKIKPREMAKLTFTTGLVYSKTEALRVSEKYHDRHIYLRQTNLGWVKGQIGLRHLNISMEKAHIYQRLGGRILYLAPYLRAQSEVLISNRRNQSALWAYGISGDLPILLTRIHDEKDMDMIRELLRGHEYLRLKGLKVDLVILNEHTTSYLQNLQDELMRQILISGHHSLLDKPGGIFIRRADLIPAEDLVLLKSVARVSLFANKGTLVDQLKRRPHEKELPVRFVATTQKKTYPRETPAIPKLEFNNGLGGFSPDGREYIIHLKNEQWTPAPWINVVANKKDFGFIISESGQGYTWSVNSRENRLSSWSNDPVSDPSSEAIYIRDEESGAFWSPTPLPIRGQGSYVISHGQGYSEFKHDSHGISQKLSFFVPLNDSVKIIRLQLKNSGDKVRKLSVTSYIEWVLGFSRTQSAQTLTTSWIESEGAILARNTYNNEFAHRVAFMSMENHTSYTCDRKEFIGRNGSLSAPVALSRKNLSKKSGGGIDPCGAIQSIFELNPGEEKEIIILIGQGHDQHEAESLVQTYKDSQQVAKALSEVTDYWDETLGTLTIKTPDASMDMLVNRWLLYQTLACRIWARSAFYQSGGAFGYRDQLQDVMAMVYSHPEITREQIKLAASRQFPEGDVQHWWHPPTGRGVRTRFSDDLLWLPFVTNYYLSITGDDSILDEVVPFIETPVLTNGHDETYTHPETSSEVASVYDHCCRTMDRSLKVGQHGLPLMGSGDWNDGMSRVGHEGKGESVWMAWFLIKTLREFVPHCEKRKDFERAKEYLAHIHRLKEAVEANAWDGQWYLRAFFDDGDKLGSHLSEECKIDAIAQSWSLISGEGNPERSKTALAAVNSHLIDRENQIIKLFSPPFDKSKADPGYIKGYLPGVRENGGQYTHAAIWTMMAYAVLGDGHTATELFSMINPINRSATKTGSQKYKVEPYVISADIYGVFPNIGRGGWSWYTGSASWMYRAAIESILGFKIRNDILTINPCIPKDWNHFEITYRKRKTVYHIQVLNNQPENFVELDGRRMEKLEFKVVNDGLEHKVTIASSSSLS